MTDCIIIFGPPAVGKMTVGMELEKITGYKLFHNHMTVELLLNFFQFGSASFRRLDKLFRFELFREIAKSDLRGLIFTFVWALDQKDDWEYVAEIQSVFSEGKTHLIELVADQQTRLKRNTTNLRLDKKPSKRNTERSEKNLREIDRKYRVNSIESDDFSGFDNFLTIDNSNMNASEVANLIKEKLNL